MQTNTRPDSSRNIVHRHFHSIIAILILFIIFAGFAQTYYLKFLFPSDPLSLLLQIHGLVMSLWILVFVYQVRLIATNNTSLHRRIGKWGMLLGAFALLIGMLTAIDSARRFQNEAGGLSFLAMSLGGILIFAGLILLGYVFRKQRDFHSRLMLMANLSVLTPAIARLPLESIQNASLIFSFLLKDAFILAYLIFDIIKTRRLHPASAWPSFIIIAAFPFCRWIGQQPEWHAFARSLVNL